MKINRKTAITAAVLTALACSLLTGCGEAEKKQELQLAPEAVAEAAAQAVQARPGSEEQYAQYEAAVQEQAVSQDSPVEAAVQEPDNETAQPETTPSPSGRKYTAEDYEAAGVNELNSVPILMYHRIYDLTNDETD